MEDDSIAAKREELVVELYRTLRSEASVYIEKVPALWLQKFILIGTMLAFLLTQKQSLDFIGERDPAELAYDLALASVPILACLLDAKILEYALHARVISRFIEDEFSKVSQLTRWEATLWGYSSSAFLSSLVKIRSASTVLVTVAPTLMIIVLDTALIYSRRRSVWVLIGGAALGSVYLAGSLIAVRRVWPRAGSGDSEPTVRAVADA